MPTKPKAFDPLSSLFDVPDAIRPEEPLPDPAPVQAAPPPPEAPAPPVVPTPASPPVDPVALARQLGKAAAARAQPAAPPPPAPAPAPPPAPAPAPRAAAPARTGGGSSILDRAPPPGKAVSASAAAAAAAAAKPAAPRPVAPVAPPPRPVAPPAPVAPPVAAAPPRPAPPPRAPAPAPKKTGSRLDDIASTPTARPRSAAEAARFAAEEEDRAAAARAAAPPPAPKPVAPVAPAPAKPAAAAPAPAKPAAPPSAAGLSALLAGWLPNAAGASVLAVYPVTSVDVLRAVWKALRARHAADGAWDRALAASAVLAALDRSPASLVAAHVQLPGADLLVWVDTATGAPIASFADATVYLAGLTG